MLCYSPGIYAYGYIVFAFPFVCSLVRWFVSSVLDELLYADDMDKNASTEAKMQRAMDQVSQSCDNYDLTISTKKTGVVHQPAPGVTGRNFPPVSFFPGERMGRPILSPGKKLTSQFFPHPVSFFPPCKFFVISTLKS